MDLFKDTKFDFIGKRKLFYGISLALLVASLAAAVVIRPRLGIEFTGGTLIQVRFKELPGIDKVREALNAAGWEGYSLQSQPEDHTIIVRVRQGERSTQDISNEIISALKKNFSGNVADIPDRVEFVGPVIGKKLALDALMAILGSFAVIIIYVAYRFRNWPWGVVGVMALMHDVFITFGLLVVTDREITLVVVAALLTLAGYSINDTIVIFDRVRENLRASRKESLKDLYNRSLNETLSRTLNTSFMAFLAAASLFFGGDVLWDFALAMSFGIVIGSYSTIAVCISLIYQWEMRGKHA